MRGSGIHFWCADFFGALDSPPSEIIAIDDQNIAKIKHGPRIRDTKANLIDQPASVKAKIITNAEVALDTSAKLAASMFKVAYDSVVFNATVLQSDTVYGEIGEIQTTYAETSAFYKTHVSYIRGTDTKFKYRKYLQYQQYTKSNNLKDDLPDMH